jgi:hypothetical protein
MGLWLAVSVRAVTMVMLVATVLPAAAALLLVAIIGVLLGLPLVLMITLALVAVYSPDPNRQRVAKDVFVRLLNVLRPRESPRAPALRRRGRSRPEGGDSLPFG